ncbi:thiamine-phosphate kinase [Roseibium litorale]|uniref:Thiamine-monophosphate kinase n=1 Tax=Roseibium litorale TaxID=2803841 RepID=A0ABR9CTT5_9HYPH|nr:thiamine-phosphate kinase [Roseibium litorale]MBD8894278.1 thiamine-phosphate kinase [Roseibium litorale]
MAGDRPHEFELIKRYFAPLATDPGSLGLTDDASVYTPAPGMELVLTKDMLAADVHFFAGDPPEAIAAKALRVNLSDLAAKGARPRAYLLGLGLPDDWSAEWLERFASGLSGDQAAFDVALAGGDTIRSGQSLQLSITAIGEVPEGTAVRRTGGRAGDLLYVSGTIGDAAAGLKERLDPGLLARNGLDEDGIQHLLTRYLLPQPRVRLAETIRLHAHAAMDVSDGLLADAAHMAKASRLSLTIDLDKVPLSAPMRQLQTMAPELFLSALSGGDDYEILSLVPPEQTAAFEAAALSAGCPVTCIGVAGKCEGGVSLLRNDQPLDLETIPGFRHF